MAEQVERGELLELTQFAPHLAIAECVPGLSCDVFAGGEEMSMAVGVDVSQQLPGCELRDGVVISNSSDFECWILVYLRVRNFRPVKGPLTGSQLRSAFSVINTSASGVDDVDSNVLN